MNFTLIRLASCCCVLGLIGAGLCFDLSASAGNPGQNANSSTTMQDPLPTNAPMPESPQLDISGTYEGTFNCPDAGVTGEQTLTITGNTFTLSDGKSGRITSATTRGYTGVTMQFGELVLASRENPTGTRPVIVSMRARKSGNRLTLSTVPNARQVCGFTPKR